MRRLAASISILAAACGTPDDAETTSAGDSSDTSSDTGETETGTGSVGPTPGCGVDSPPGAYNLSITVNGDVRSYIAVIPENYDPTHAYPLVFVWHGLGGSGQGARGFGLEAAAGDAAIFVYPNGELQPLGGTGWNFFNESPDMRLFDALVEELSTGACIDVDRIFSAGFSFGAYFSNSLACFRGEQVRAIGSVSGGPFGMDCAAPTAAWFAHDPVDETVAFSQGTGARDQRLAENGCGDTTMPTDPSPCVAYDGCMDGMPVHWCEHDQSGPGGHSWPPFAADAIWAFFASF